MPFGGMGSRPDLPATLRTGDSVKSVLLAAVIALAVSILCTPIAIRYFRQRGIGQEIRDVGPASHQAKRGTPTMGGAVIIIATVIGYAGAHLFTINQPGHGPTASGLLALYLVLGMGILGFLDDFTKLYMKRNLGLNKTQKLIGQLIVAIVFGVLALRFHNRTGQTPATTHLSFVRDLLPFSLGSVGFIVLVFILVGAFSNAVNFTDGADGLCAGSSAMVLGAYVIINFYEFRNACGMPGVAAGCYQARDPLDLALLAAAGLGGCFGFLWWNARPARIFMGDVGSMPLGALMAGLAIMSHTELLLLVLAALPVAELASVVIQVFFFRTRRIRVFKMAPFHHHFEIAGWDEATVIVRFWIISGIAVAIGLGVFYGEFISHGLT